MSEYFQVYLQIKSQNTLSFLNKISTFFPKKTFKLPVE